MRTLNASFIALILATTAGCAGEVQYTRTSDVAPPSPSVDQVAYWPKPGFVRIEGHFVLADGKWQWEAGRWTEPEDSQVYRDAAWVQRDNRWYYMEGGWEDARPGHVRVRGHWERRDGKLIWISGYWQPEREGFKWQDGHWRNHGNVKVFELGRWVPDTGPQTAHSSESKRQ